MLEEDVDLAIAMRFNVDPFAVNHVWPENLRDRALAFMGAEGRADKKRRERQQRQNRIDAASGRGGRRR